VLGTHHPDRQMRESMTDRWYKADVVFDCPNCGKRSVETLIANASRHNPGGVAEGVRKTVAPLTCRVCNKPAPGGQQFQIGMNDLKPEDVSKLNLKLPEIPAFPAEKPCPCGLHGKTYGECCSGKGHHAMGNAMLLGSTPIIVPGARTHISSSVVMGDTRFRPLWNRLFYSPQEQPFHQFLDGLVVDTMGKEWFEQQLTLPYDKQNAIVRWRSSTISLLKKPGDADDAISTGHTLTGPAKAYLCLGYDLYWLQLVHKLPESLVKRLKEFQPFQGARYEILIAAVFARAGFDIDWIDDTKATGKHPEFIATHRQTQQKVGVETKSRKRQGSYNFAGTVSPETHLKGDVFGLYETAIKQSPQGGLPFLIFIDANVPDTIPAGIPGYSDFSIDAVPWMKEIRDGLVAIWQASEQASSESAVFVTNLAFYYGSNDEPSPAGMGSFFPSLKPQVPIVNEPMIQDLIYCLKFYAEVPRQI